MRFFLLILFVGVASADDPADIAMDKFIRNALEIFRSIMKTGYAEYHIPVLDPLAVPDISQKVNESLIHAQVNISDLLVKDLSTFQTKRVDFNTDEMSLKLGLAFPLLNAKGIYHFDGDVTIIPIKGHGNATFNISNFQVNISTSVARVGAHIQLTSLDLGLEFSALKVDFDNIFGSKFLGNLVNTVLSTFGKSFFDRERATIEKQLSKILLEKVNAILRNISLDVLGSAVYYTNSLSSANFNHLFDEAVAGLQPILVKSDPLKLPDVSTTFKKKVAFVTFKGTANLSGGSVKGLSTLHRTGDAIIAYDASGINVSANIGINDLEAHYDCRIKWKKIKVSPKVTAKIRSVSVFVEMRQNVVTGKRQLISFKITSIDKPKFKIRGISIFGKLVSLITNLAKKPIINALKKTIEREVRPILEQLIQFGKIKGFNPTRMRYSSNL